MRVNPGRYIYRSSLNLSRYILVRKGRKKNTLIKLTIDIRINIKYILYIFKFYI